MQDLPQPRLALMLNVNEQLRGREAGKLIVQNVATGTSAEFDLLKN
jgi:hypothetical protein